VKKRILFVDDEANVLQGLQRMLRGMREEWDMRFAGGGEEALKHLAGERFDVVVSDMRMPGMNGAQLLTEVMNHYPETVRIILSGQADSESVLKSIGPAHQYMSKPCEPEVLKSVISRACSLRQLLADDALEGMISRMDSLPSLPSLYGEIMEELSGKSPSIQKVGKIISQDVGMAAKILQLVNSAFFGLRHKVSNPTQAVSFLGLDTIRALVLSVHIFSQCDSDKVSHFPLDRLWEHSFSSAVLAKAMAREESQPQAMVDECFMAGLLHDVGKLILAMNFPEPYRQIRERAAREGAFLGDLEREAFGGTHAEAGAYLLGLWGLPDPIVEGLAYHHCPSQYTGQGFGTVLAVHVADFLEGERTNSNRGQEKIPLDEEFLSRLNLLSRLPAWKEAGLAAAGEGEKNE
jgi:HD-like signal output (HDOD) protein